MDHVANYRPPQDSDDLDDVTKTLHAKGCGVKTPPYTSSDSLSGDDDVPVKKPKGEVCFCSPDPRWEPLHRALGLERALSSGKHRGWVDS